MQPCVGTVKEDLSGDAHAGFPSVVRYAERMLERVSDLQSESEGAWYSGIMKGYLPSIPKGVVAGVLGVVCDQPVLWSVRCTGVGAKGYGDVSGKRCLACKAYSKETIAKRAEALAAGERHPMTNNSLLASHQKVSTRLKPFL